MPVFWNSCHPALPYTSIHVSSSERRTISVREKLIKDINYLLAQGVKPIVIAQGISLPIKEINQLS